MRCASQHAHEDPQDCWVNASYMAWHAKPCLFGCQRHDVADSHVAAVLQEALTADRSPASSCLCPKTTACIQSVLALGAAQLGPQLHQVCLNGCNSNCQDTPVGCKASQYVALCNIRSSSKLIVLQYCTDGIHNLELCMHWLHLDTDDYCHR